jgi:hypothetical protein
MGPSFSPLKMAPATRLAVRARHQPPRHARRGALTDPRDLLRLVRSCRRFATKCIAAPAAAHRSNGSAAGGTAGTASGGTAAAPQQHHSRSIVEEVARRWISGVDHSDPRVRAKANKNAPTRQ